MAATTTTMSSGGVTRATARAARRCYRRSATLPVQPEALERRTLLAMIYVDDTASGPARDGASWATAFTGLQPALDAAAATAGPDAVRVAAGTYRPTARADATDPRSVTFRLVNGV